MIESVVSRLPFKVISSCPSYPESKLAKVRLFHFWLSLCDYGKQPRTTLQATDHDYCMNTEFCRFCGFVAVCKINVRIGIMLCNHEK